MYVHLETERLCIRPIHLLDAAFIMELVNSVGWIQYIGNRNVNDADGARNYIQKILDKPGSYYNVFELKASGQAIGIVTLLNREHQSFPDIGFAILPGFEGNGYALEASKAYLDEIVKSNTYQKILAITIPGNSRSIHVLKKLGLQYEQELEHNGEVHALYGMMIDS